MQTTAIFHTHKKQKGGALLALLLVVLALLAAIALYVSWYVRQPLDFVPGVSGQRLQIEVPKGAGAQTIVTQLQDSGVQVQPQIAYWWLRLQGSGLKAGYYEIKRGSSLHSIALQIKEGKQSLLSLTVPEGWTLRQVRALLKEKAWLQQDSAQMSERELLQALDLEALPSLEGQLAPDTYVYAPGTSDLVFYKQAHQHLMKNLQAAWDTRAPDVQVKTPQEALILASIVEKETGRGADRALIAAVFHNRLRINMPLQTDPTVIYGMGERYAGNIRKKDLQTDTPYNTYTRRGLPPTPIAMAGKAALHATLHPANTKALYFVARGDGSSHFSDNLDAHNRAVRQFILKR